MLKEAEVEGNRLLKSHRAMHKSLPTTAREATMTTSIKELKVKAAEAVLTEGVGKRKERNANVSA